MCVEHSKCSPMAVKFIIDATDLEYLKEHEIKKNAKPSPWNPDIDYIILQLSVHLSMSSTRL